MPREELSSERLKQLHKKRREELIDDVEAGEIDESGISELLGLYVTIDELTDIVEQSKADILIAALGPVRAQHPLNRDRLLNRVERGEHTVAELQYLREGYDESPADVARLVNKSEVTVVEEASTAADR